MSGLRATAIGLFDRALGLVPAAVVRRVATALITHRVETMPPADGLRFLFTVRGAVDNAVNMGGVRYGDGVNVKIRIIGYLDWYVARVEAGERVLDVGSGVGALAHAMAARAGAEVTGIEIVPALYERARARFHHPKLAFRQGDVLSDPVGGPYDTITLSNVLEHLPERAALLRRLAAETGARRFLIRVPLYERDWTVGLMDELGLDSRSDATHEIEYTVAALEAEMAEAGLTIRDLTIRWGEIWAEVAA